MDDVIAATAPTVEDGEDGEDEWVRMTQAQLYSFCRLTERRNTEVDKLPRPPSNGSPGSKVMRLWLRNHFRERYLS